MLKSIELETMAVFLKASRLWKHEGKSYIMAVILNWFFFAICRMKNILWTRHLSFSQKRRFLLVILFPYITKTYIFVRKHIIFNVQCFNVYKETWRKERRKYERIESCTKIRCSRFQVNIDALFQRTYE